ncbi:MAG: RsmB/NOP family class I SAM-dependent RNA methyltransferase, partial [Puniceicoccaceae bacterium]
DLDRHLGDLPEPERDRIREHRPGQPDPAILRRAFPDVPFAWPQLLHSEIRDFLDPFFSDDDCETRIAALIQRPPAWLRWHPRNPAEPEPPPDHPSLSPSPDLPGAWRIDGAAAPPASEGGYWIPQDISSQAALHFAAPRPGERWLDACAGGGGKYLQLAALTQANPMPDAADVRREALLELIRRSAAVGMKTGSLWLAAPENYRPLIRPEDPLPSGPPGNYDGILVDAPCTGSGTWGRHPFLRHQITAARLRELTELQFNLLQRLAPLVRPGGRILYVVCSVATAECAGVAERFLDTHPDFLPAPLAAASLPDLTANGTLLIPPHRLNGDGFTLALFKRRPE